MNDEYLKLIERYYCGELTPEERAAFEERQTSDSGFRQEVEAYQKTVQLIRLEGRRRLKARLSERGKLMDAEKKKTRLRWWAGLAALAILAGWWLFSLEKEAAVPAAPGAFPRQDSTEAVQPIVPDTALPPPQAKEMPADSQPFLKPSVTERPSIAERIFAANFQPYRDESLEPSVRGEGDLTPEEIFLQLYWDRKYREAIAAFEKMEPASRSKGDLQFLQANSLLALGRTKAALTLLKNLQPTRFQAEAKWLLALAFLKNGELEQAKAQLTQIAGDAASPRRGDASRLLKEIN